MFDINKYTRNDFNNNINKYTKNGKITYQTGLFEDIYNTLGSFNFVFAGEIIEHVIDDELFIKALRAVIKPGGSWCLTTPNNIGGDLPEHARQYSKDSLSVLLSKYFPSFQIEEIPPIADSWPFLLAYGTLR
jgi:2-polyprenyl-3-methyl-5-hydroxy-6-metoxy-1,4-benzoquinol methylase